jgi:hypothetical protein
MLDLVKLPMGLGGVQAANFSKWSGKPDAAEFIKLRDAIRHKLRDAAQAAPAEVVPIRADRPEASPTVQTYSPPHVENPVSDKGRFGQKAWVIAGAIAIVTGAGGYLAYKTLDGRIHEPSVTPTPIIANPPSSPAAPAVSNGYTVYLHTKRPQPQVDTLTQRLKQAGYDIASPDKDADNDSGSASPRSGVDYAATDDVAKNRDAADKAARIANELLGTDIKPRAQSAMAASKLGIWLPYTGDYKVTIHFAGDFNRERDIIPFAQKLRAAGWHIQEPTTGGGERDKAAANLCEVRFRASDDRAFADLLAAEVPKMGIAPGRASVKEPDSKVGAGELQLWIGSGICK